MHFAIRYLTEYRYAEPVTDNLNALRVKPATTTHQRVDDFGVRVDPETRLHQHLDYYGTTVIEFGISKPHEQLAIDVRARVATSPPPPPPETGWEPVEDASYAVQGGEYRLPFGSEPDSVGDRRARRPDTRAATPAATLRAVAELIPERFEYRAGVTYVGSTVEDLLEAGAGVCQDFAHLALVLLRRHGLAARYVCGYLFAPDGDVGRLRRGRHARLDRGADPRPAAASPSGSPPIPPTAGSPARTTSRSATAATTPTCRRSRASSAAARRRSSTRRCG